MRLQSFVLIKQRLRCSIYPKASRVDHALPRLSAWDWNFNQFPFCDLVIGWSLRIALLLADERCQETRVLSGVQDSRLDMLLLIPRYS